METKITPPHTLPDELIVEVFMRLSVKSLLRFKCVCKSWLSLISDTKFAESYFEVAAAPTDRLLLRCSDSPQVNALDIDAPLHDDSTDVVFNIPTSSSALKREGCWIDVAGSYRGFVLLTVTGEYFNLLYFIIWNPATGVHKQVNNAMHGRGRGRGHLNEHLCGIGYDSSTNDYVIVHLTLPRERNGQTEVQYFSLRTNSWSCVETTFYLGPGRGPGCTPGLLLNGALHWLLNSVTIIAFDAMERRLSKIPISPDLAIALELKRCCLHVKGGCLCIYSFNYFEMWTMKEYKVQSSWAKSFVLFTNGCNLVYGFSPICFTKNGEILGSGEHPTLVKLNDKGELLEREKDRFVGLQNYGVYRESLVSLPAQFEEATGEDEHGQQRTIGLNL